MFKNEYQGGPFVEVFSAQGKDPAAKWKFFGSPSAIWKDFDKEVKSFVFNLEGSSQTNKMQLPKENKQILGLIQRFLILQVHVPLGQDFSTELLITDLGNIKRRLYLSTIHKELSATPLHAKIPLFIIKRKIWCNLCIDLVSFTNGVFKGAVFQSLDGIIVSANCKLRKIFTMKLMPQDTSEEDDIYGTPFTADEPTDVIPRNCQFTTDVLQVTQLLDMTKMRLTEVKRGQPFALTEQDKITNRGPGSTRNTKNQDVTHIAFGSKVPGPPPSTGRSLRSSSETVKCIGIRSSRSLYQSSLDKRDEIMPINDCTEMSPSRFYESSDQINKENIHQTRKETVSSILDQPIIQPHPPREASADKNSMRRIRVRSTGKDRREINNDSFTSGQCKTEDKPSVEIRIPSCQRMNSAETLNNSSLLQQSISQTDEWIFPERLPLKSTKQLRTNEDQTCNNLPLNMKVAEKRESIDQSCELQSAQKDVFTYLSRPRSAPRGKSPNLSLEEYTLPLDVSQIRKEERRGARMEDDFYGSDSSEEDYDWRNYQPSRLSTSELQMLASLKRQQHEELEESGTSHGLSASQIDNCNVSISMSSDDTATWNSCLPPPVNQGRHYQKEMNPLSHSNPRDWLNVFSPPIIPPSQTLAEHMDATKLEQLNQSANTQGQDDFNTEEDEEVLTLLYDPCLNCYFDPETGKYYELA